jgi:hypothetical protein
MNTLKTYEYQVQVPADASGDGSLFTSPFHTPGFLYRVQARGTGFSGTGTLLIKTEAKTGKPQTTYLDDEITTTTGIDVTLYNLVQDADGADISGEYNQRFVRRGERLEVIGDDFVDGTLDVVLTIADMPLPATR